MSSDIKVRVDRAIAGKVFPGCVIGTIRANGTREICPFGRFAYDTDAQAVREDTIYDLASVTKSIPTASLALLLIDEGKLRPADKVRRYLPELQNDYGATIGDLLTYRVQGPQLSTLKDRTADRILEYVFEHGFSGPPADPVYTNLPALLLGLIVERIAGDTLDSLAQKTFFNPLHMKRTSYFPQNPQECVPTEIDERGEVQGLPHDESAYVFAKARRAIGHAGLFATAPDILNFLEALLRGEYPYVTDGAQRGLGWQLEQPWFMEKSASPQTFGKTGFTGTSVVCDMERGIASVILSNRTYPKRHQDMSAINAFRADIANILLR